MQECCEKIKGNNEITSIALRSRRFYTTSSSIGNKETLRTLIPLRRLRGREKLHSLSRKLLRRGVRGNRGGERVRWRQCEQESETRLRKRNEP